MRSPISLAVACGCLLLQLAVCAHAAPPDAPPNWPWRGFVLTSNADSSPEDIGVLKKAFSINAVRLTFKPKQFGEQSHIPVPEVWGHLTGWLNRMLDACRDNGVTAVVSFSQLLYAYGIEEWKPEFWDNSSYRAIQLATIARLVQECASRGSEVGAYEFLTEPVVVRGSKKSRPETWNSLMQEIVATVRKYDRNRYVCITPGPGAMASGYGDFKPLDDPRIIYTAHMYTPHQYTHQGIHREFSALSYPGRVSGTYYDREELRKFLNPMVEFQKKYSKQYVWIAEFSAARWAEGSRQYLKDVVDIFEANHWSWTYFSFNGYHAWNPYYNSAYSTDETGSFSKQYVGTDSERWQTLQQIFSTVPAGSAEPARKTEKPQMKAP